MEWPEQQVAEVARETTAQVTSLTYRTLAGGVRQMLILIPRLSAGDTARALVTFKVTKRNIAGPADGVELRAPAKPARELQLYLGASPSIETTHPEIQRLAAEIVAGKRTDWDKAQAIYDWVREKIKYKFDEQLQSTLTALKRGEGDCEELTSLFIACCRNQGIPARSVWVPGHCYPEFYLEQADGQGCWFPCQAAGTREFGAMHEARPILQKGDRFIVTGDPKPKRYVAETFAAKNAAAPPRVQFIRKPLTGPEEKRDEASGPFGP
jgi:transglutaminase-like putative cysteine protease